MPQTRWSAICLLFVSAALITLPTSAAEKQTRQAVQLDFGNKTDAGPEASRTAEMTVVVTGVGLDPAKAKENAYSNALEQVVGVLVDAETIVENDQIIRERILTVSRGHVEELDLIDTWQEDGLHFVRIRAKVAAGELGQKLKRENVAIRKIPAELIYQRVKHEILSEENAKKMFRSATADFSPDKLLSVSVLDKPPQVDRTGQQVKLTVTYRLTPNMDAWKSIYGKVKSLLDKIARSETSCTAVIRNMAILPGTTRWGTSWGYATPPKIDSDKDMTLNLFESSNREATSLDFHGYVLPNWLEPEVLGLALRQQIYRVCLSLLDEEDREVVAVKRPLAVTQIIKLSSRYRSFKSSAIGPLPYLDGRFRNFADLTETFTLDVEQLGRVDKCAAFIELAEEAH